METCNRQVVKLAASLVVLIACIAAISDAQQTNTIVPTLVNFSGTLSSADHKPLTGIVGVTFALYQDSGGGAPLWMETQNVQPDKNGHYSVQLGAASSQGLPASVFASGEARWLGVQVQGEAEQPRVMLLSVPYALKAGDAQTLGGKPASAFLSAPGNNSLSPNTVGNNTLTGKGTKDYVPLWLSGSKLGNSKIFQSASGDLGVGTTTPAANLDVNGTTDIRNTLSLFPSGSAPTLSINGTAFSVSNTGTVTFVSGQTFPGTGTITGVTAGTGLTGGGNERQCHPERAEQRDHQRHAAELIVNRNSGWGNDGRRQDLSRRQRDTRAAELQRQSDSGIRQRHLGMHECRQRHHYGVTAGSDLTGGGNSGNVTLNLDITKVPQLNAANTFTGRPDNQRQPHRQRRYCYQRH